MVESRRLERALARLSRAEKKRLKRRGHIGTNEGKRRSADEVGAVHFPTIHHLEKAVQ
jgi:hypothetical protein